MAKDGEESVQRLTDENISKKVDELLAGKERDHDRVIRLACNRQRAKAPLYRKAVRFFSGGFFRRENEHAPASATKSCGMPEAKQKNTRTSQALVRPRSSGNWSFRESASSVASQLPAPAPERRHRNSKAEIRRVRKLGGTILVVHAEGPPAARRASVSSACQARG